MTQEHKHFKKKNWTSLEKFFGKFCDIRHLLRCFEIMWIYREQMYVTNSNKLNNTSNGNKTQKKNKSSLIQPLF